MRRLLSFTRTVPALVLVGCASLAPSEPWQKYLLGPASKGAISKELQRAPCARLSAAITVHVERIKALEAKAKSEQAAPPPHLWSALQRSFGARGSGIAALEGVAKERAAADAANVALASKECPTVDIDALLKSSQPK